MPHVVEPRSLTAARGYTAVVDVSDGKFWVSSRKGEAKAEPEPESSST